MYSAQTEYGTLKRVLLHRPGAELQYVTPTTYTSFQFRAPIDIPLFQAQYDGLAAALAQAGAETIFLTDVLRDEPEALAYIARRPNLAYTRDLAVVTRGGAVLMSMWHKGRKGDPWVIGLAMQKLGIPVLGEITPPGFVEGGGIQFLDERTMIVALCDRTTEVAILQLCDMLLGKHLDEIVMVPVPEGEVHIDGSLMILDRNLALGYRPSLELYPSTVFRKGSSPHHIWLTDFLAQRDVELIEVTPEEHQAMCINFIPVGPRRVVGWEWATRLMQEIEARGGRAVGIPGDELVKGNGGPHCLTCPIFRA